MGYQGQRHFRIELGTTFVVQPCEQHKDGGYEADCSACERTPDKQLPVPHLKGFWVEVLNPALLPYGKKKELYTPVSDDTTAAELQARRERIVASLITAWNLEPIDLPEGEKAEVLPYSTPDETLRSLDRAPDIVGLVFAGINREQRSSETVPKASATA